MTLAMVSTMVRPRRSLAVAMKVLVMGLAAIVELQNINRLVLT